MWCRVAYMRWLSVVAHGLSPEVNLCHAGVQESDNEASYAASQSVDLFPCAGQHVPQHQLGLDTGQPSR